MIRIGVDFGGTKIEAAALDDQGRFQARVRAPSPPTYGEGLAVVAKLVEQAERQAGASVTRIGVGTPGSISPVSGLIRNANSVRLNDQPFRTDLERITGRAVRMVNDASCLALSEATDGAGAGFSTVFAVNVGTGCGGGVVVDGRLVEGASGVGGEWGHIPLPWPRADELEQPRCWCGRRGCMETWVSGSGFKRWSGMSAHDADLAAQAGDGKAVAALDLLADRIARGLAVVIDVIDPDVIVLGGGVSNVDALYPSIQGKLIAHVFSDMVGARIVKNRHGDSSGVRGAAWLFDAGDAH